MDSLKMLALATWLFSVSGWIIALIALSTLQGWCNGKDLQACSFVVGGGSDSQLFSYMWWIVCAQFVVMLLYVALLPSRAMRRFKIAVVAMFTILALKFMDFANESLHIYWQLDKVHGDGTLMARLQAFVAGCCLTFIGNVFLIFGTSVLEDEAPPSAGAHATPPQMKATTAGSPV